MVSYMKKTNAILGTLALASSLIAATAMADTSSTSVSGTAPSLRDKIVFKYWGLYNGPSISNPTEYTNDSGAKGVVGGNGAEVQNIDSTISLGYKLNSKLVLYGNYRF